MTFFQIFLVAVAGAVAAGASVWFGWKELRRSKVLGHPIPFSNLGLHTGRYVALRGRPRSLADTSDPVRLARLWARTTVEVYTGGKGSRWSRVSSRVEMSPFVLHGEGDVSVTVASEPTEVHGTEKDGSELELMVLPGTTRTRVEWLPAAARGITVAGRLVRTGNAFSIVPDEELGLLFSTYEAGTQAVHEAILGWLGVAGAPLLWVVALAVIWVKYRVR
jgi:hypothetical protein